MESMENIVDRLEQWQARYASMLAEAFSSDEFAGLSDADQVRLLEVSGRIQRGTEAVQVETTVHIRERSEGLRAERLTSSYGCDRPADLLRMALRIDRTASNRLVKVAGFTARTRGISAGEYLPAQYDSLRGALHEGAIGVAGFLAAVEPIEASRGRLMVEQRIEADRQLGAFARGMLTDADGRPVPDAERAPAPTPDELGQLAHVLAAYLDPDGAEPRDDLASRTRGLGLGAKRDGCVPIRGYLLPEVAAQLSLMWDSLLNPRVESVAAPPGVHFVDSQQDPSEDPLVPLDDRSRLQKQHDAFATILMAAARGGELPDLGGAAPTLVVTVDAEDYASGEGWADVSGTDVPVPMRVAAQVGCAGGVQRVLFDEHGRIVGLGTSARVFNALQRRAIVARDGGCIIPGCTIPATWCELHHVRDYALGGETHTDNGVALCWHHHRTLHLSEWQIRMRHGVPEIRGPAWWDRRRAWRPARQGRMRSRSRPAVVS